MPPRARSFDKALAGRYHPTMARSFFYLIDGLTAEKGQQMKRALEQVPEVAWVIVRPVHGVIEVQSSKDPEAQVKLACSLAGTAFRVKVGKRSLY